MKNQKKYPNKLKENQQTIITLLKINEDEFNDILFDSSIKYIKRKEYDKIKSLRNMPQTHMFRAWWENKVANVNHVFICIYIMDKEKTKNELLELYKKSLLKINSYPEGAVLTEILIEIESLKRAIRGTIK